MFIILKPTLRIAQPVSRLSVVTNCLLKNRPALGGLTSRQSATLSTFSSASKRINLCSDSLTKKLYPSTPSQIISHIHSRPYSQPTNSSSIQKKDSSNNETAEHNYEPKEPDDEPEQQGASFAWSDLKRLFAMITYDRRLLVLAIFLLLTSCCIGLMLPKAYGLVLDAAKNVVDGELPPIIYGLTLIQFISAIGGLLCVGIAANYGRIIILRILGEQMVARLRAGVIKKTISQDAEFFDINKVGDLISRLNTDAYIVSRSMTQNISDGCKAVIVGGIGLGTMIYISPQLSLVFALFVPIAMIGSVIYGAKVRNISRRLQKASGNLSKVGEEQLNAIKTTQSFVAERKELFKYNNAIRRVFSIGREEAYLNAKFYSGYSFVGDSAFLLTLGYGAILVAQGSISVGELAAFMMYSDYVSNSTYSLSTFYSDLMKGTGAASRLFDLIDRVPRINATVGEPLLEKPRGQIEFKDVSFSYPTRPKIQIFNELNFKIPENSNVCIVGPSGKGKSTITSLLLRYYDVSGGEILLDGKDISKYSVKSLRRHLGVVQQEPVLMSGTIRDNIIYGLKERNVDEERIIEAAKKANCHGFICKFPDGYDTVIGPRGALLSGGQKQRISIARALIKNPSVLILDEATSALDSKSEFAINLTLQQLMKDEKLTTISIAHRLSTIRKADIIIVLGYDGKVAEIGNFERLYSDRESALYKLLNDEKTDDDRKHKKKHPDRQSSKEDQSGYENNVDEFTEDFIRKEIIQKGLEDLRFDQSITNAEHVEETAPKQ